MSGAESQHGAGQTSRLGRIIGAACWCITCLGSVVAATQKLPAATMFLGPTPYLSQADSPFDLSELGTTFFLEDFEDGELNTPGIFQPIHLATDVGVVGPSPLTDSVDGDNGVIDGLGTSGHSLASTDVMFIPTGVPQFNWFIWFDFHQEALGFLPNTFGFVWTDGSPGMTEGIPLPISRVTLDIFDQNLDSIASVQYDGFGDDVFTGTTADDHFIGVVSDTPIARVQITTFNVGGFFDGDTIEFEIDHVQYGLQVPEPAAMCHSVMLLAVLVVLCGKNRVSVGGVNQFLVGGSRNDGLQQEHTGSKP